MGKQQPEFVSIEIGGTTYFGTFRVGGDQVVVATAVGTQSNPLGSAPADMVARVLLRDIILRSRRQ